MASSVPAGARLFYADTGEKWPTLRRHLIQRLPEVVMTASRLYFAIRAVYYATHFSFRLRAARIDFPACNTVSPPLINFTTILPQYAEYHRSPWQ